MFPFFVFRCFRFCAVFSIDSKQRSDLTRDLFRIVLSLVVPVLLVILISHCSVMLGYDINGICCYIFWRTFFQLKSRPNTFALLTQPSALQHQWKPVDWRDCSGFYKTLALFAEHLRFRCSALNSVGRFSPAIPLTWVLGFFINLITLIDNIHFGVISELLFMKFGHCTRCDKENGNWSVLHVYQSSCVPLNILR